MTPNGVVTTVAGLAGQKGIADGVGSAARFISPCAVLTASDGTVLVADRESDAIRKVAPDGTVTHFAGVAGDFGAIGGTGPEARFDEPWGAAFDRDGNAYVADSGNDLLRRISPAGVVTAAAVDAPSGPLRFVRFASPPNRLGHCGPDPGRGRRDCRSGRKPCDPGRGHSVWMDFRFGVSCSD